MSWILLTIISAITGSLTILLQKVLLKNERSNPFAFGFIFQLLVAFLFFSYVVVTKTFEFPDLSSVWVNIVLIFLGVVSVDYNRSKWKINKGHIFAFLGAMLFGLAFTNDAYIIGKYRSISSYMALAFLLPSIGIILLSPKSIKKVKYYFSFKTIGKLLLAGIFYSLSAITIFTAYKNGGQASIIAPIQRTSVILTVVLSYVYLNERKKVGNKIIGMVLTVVGALLLI